MPENFSKQERYSEIEAQQEGILIQDILETGLAENHTEAEQLVDIRKKIVKAIEDIAAEAGQRTGKLDYTSEEFWRNFADVTFQKLPYDDAPEEVLFPWSKEIEILKKFSYYPETTIGLMFGAEAKRRYIHQIIQESRILSDEEIGLFKESELNIIFELSHARPSLPVALENKKLVDSLRERIGQQKFDRLEALKGLSEASLQSFLNGYPKLFNATELATFIDEYQKMPDSKHYRGFITEKLKRFRQLEQTQPMQFLGSMSGHSKSGLEPIESKIVIAREEDIKNRNLEFLRTVREEMEE